MRHSNSKNLPYYFNFADKTSRWEPPADTDTEKLKVYMAKYHSGATGTGANTDAYQQQIQQQQQQQQAGKIRAAHLLVKHRDSRRPSSWREANITRSKDDARSIIEGYEKRIQSGEISLGELALTESDCSSARKRGDLGFFGKGDMQKEFEDASFGLQTGQVSGIIETASGLHLIER